jgi:hypothetical protein
MAGRGADRSWQPVDARRSRQRSDGGETVDARRSRQRSDGKKGVFAAKTDR